MKSPQTPQVQPKLLKAFWCLHIDLLIDLPIQECGLNIEVINLQVETGCNGKCDLNRGESDNWGKGVGVVDPFSLREALCHQLSLVPYYLPTNIPLEAKDEFTANQGK